MLRNYLSAALRNLLRNRLYAAINIAGLAVGFSAALLIGLYVRHEYAFDRFWPEYARTYRVMETVSLPSQPPIHTLHTFAHIGAALKADFPEIEAVSRLVGGAPLLRRGEIETRGEAYWADPNFFSLFPMTVVAGTLDGALSRPDAIVVTRKLARQFFGRDDVAGETIEWLRAQPQGTDVQVLHVAAVVEDMPSNTNMQVDAFLSGVSAVSRLTQLDSMSFTAGGENVATFIHLKPGADIAAVNGAMEGFAQKHLPGELGGIPLAKIFKLSLEAIGDIHFLDIRLPENNYSLADEKILQAMSAIALLILAVVGCNFVGMMTARAAGRAVEVGVRKVSGAIPRQLIAQFLAECLAYVALALLVALAAVSIVLPAFGGFLRQTVTLDLFSNPGLGGAVIGVAVLLGLLSGTYPALGLARFRPGVVLKGNAKASDRSERLRQALVIFQFVTFIGLIAATLTVHRQAQYAINDRLRLPGDQIYILNTTSCPQAFKDAVARLQAVRDVSCASTSALSLGHNGTTMTAADGTEVIFKLAQVEPAFFQAFEISPLAGRLFARDRGGDMLLQAAPGSPSNPALILNETGVRALGYATPEEAVGQAQRWTRKGPRDEIKDARRASSEIVGVVPDFSLGNVRDAVEPTAYVVDPAWMEFMVLRLDGTAIPETMQAINTLWAAHGNLRAPEGAFLSRYVEAFYADLRQQSTLFVIFSSVALSTAVLGLFGLAAFTAAQRTREIGIRKAMGATRGDILRLLMWQFTRPVLWANLVAWPVSFFVMQRWLEGFAYHVDLSVWTFLAASGLALVIAVATVIGHALLVARAQPVTALRYE